MTFTIEFGWWIVPMLVTIAGFIVARSMCSDGNSGGGFLDFSAFFDMVTYLMFFVLPSLLAWLIWSLMK